MKENELHYDTGIRGIKNTLDIMTLKEQVHQLMLEVYKLKNPTYTYTDLLIYETELLKNRLDEMNGTN